MSPTADRPRRWTLPLLMRALLVLGFLLAIAATVLVVFTEQVRWLRFAVLLALWAALIAAFAVARSRREARNADQRAVDSRRTYELELHREVSARREHEIGVVKGAREAAEVRHRDELAGLREQLDRLTATLSGLLDGDLLFERLTLSAESTRIRQVGDAGRSRPGQRADPLPLPGTPTAGLVQAVSEKVPAVPTDQSQPVTEASSRHPTADSQADDSGGSAEPWPAGTGHSSGIPVADLIAAYGGASGAPRRRRRAED